LGTREVLALPDRAQGLVFVPKHEESSLNRLLAAVMAFSSLATIGCGQSGNATVTGTVSIKGQPAPEGVGITFSPVPGSPAEQLLATGRIDTQGKYTLFSGNEGTPGARPGKYKVFLSPKPSDGAYMESGKGSQPPKIDLGPIPKEYTLPETSPKEVEVKGGENTIDIQI
jgi:hypothetical protein